VTHRNSKAGGALTALQQAILEILWSGGPATSEEVRARLLPRFPLKDSSIRTLLRRLEERGFVSHSVAGKVFVYKAELGSTSVAARTVRQLIERFCHGSAEQFLIGMVDEKVLTVAQMQRLVRKVKRRK
jgi:BlaI family transcriptional regulator, penicillinase repressor